jgi:ABC transport system ATP-binding/permease protein
MQQFDATEIATPTLELRFHHELNTFRLVGDVLTLGRNSTCQCVIPSHWQVVSGIHATFKKVGSDYQIFDGDGRNQASTNGILYHNIRIDRQTGLHLRHGMQLTIGANPIDQVILVYQNPLGAAAIAAQQVVSLGQQPIYLGREENNEFVLPSPLVSRRHAVVEPITQGYRIRNLGSTNGVFIAGFRVEQAILCEGDVIQIGPYAIRYEGNSLRSQNSSGNLRLDACNLTRIVRVKGKPRCILDRVTLPIEPGQLVALVGGSGAGKSTLMKTLLGLDAATQGLVYLNGDPLRAHYNLYRTQIGYVPQDDIIHRELTVTEVLTYAARLRLPSDFTTYELRSLIEKTLSEIEMEHCRDNQVYTLSGGQRKRVSIGVELLANPKLFFLDEPTSGLDPGLDKKMMLLLRKLANAGRTVVLVTHATGNIRLCDRVAFMGRGGKLCYYGPPDQSLTFFELSSNDFADVYNELEQGAAVVDQWQNAFLRSPLYSQTITQRLSLQPDAAASQEKPTASRLPHPLSLRQFWLLSQRYFQLVKRDTINLALALLTAPVGIGLMAFTVGRKALVGDSPIAAPLALQVLFVFTCAAIWVGLSSSLQEVVREIPIYLRERLVNLRLLPYLGSKVLVLAGLAVVQTLLAITVILTCFDAPTQTYAIGGLTLHWWLGVTVTTFLTLLANIGLGLAISAFVKNAAQANSTLPLILLPQIILSGVLFDLKDVAKIGSWLMLSRWSVGAYGTLANVNELKWTPGTDVKAVYTATVDNLLLNWGILLLHAIIYLLLTLLLQKRKDPVT